MSTWCESKTFLLLSTLYYQIILTIQWDDIENAAWSLSVALFNKLYAIIGKVMTLYCTDVLRWTTDYFSLIEFDEDKQGQYGDGKHTGGTIEVGRCIGEV